MTAIRYATGFLWALIFCAAARGISGGGSPHIPGLLPDDPAASRISQPPQDHRGQAPDPGGAQRDPLRGIAEDMTEVVTDLGHERTDKSVQAKQEKIVQTIEALIKEIEDAQNQRKNGGKGAGRSGANPSSPMRDSNIAGGPGGIGDLHAPKGGRKEWGDLPPRQREQILQSKTEGFPPGFESVLQSYYRRLAQERSDGGEAAPTTRPAAP